MLKIKEIRKNKGITQDEIVAGTGIPKRSFINYEKGETDIPLLKLQDIASFLGVSISDIIGETDSKSISDNSIEIKNKGDKNNFFAKENSKEQYGISELLEIIKKKDEQIAEKDEQIKTLLGLLKTK